MTNPKDKFERDLAAWEARNAGKKNPFEIEMEANARLIDAAPDLLAALLTIAKIASEGKESDIDIESIARAAIAKAEGGS